MTRQILPTNAKPINYDLTLTPNFEDFTFHGIAIIQVQITEATNSITVNGNELVVDESKTNLTLADKTEVQLQKLEYDASKKRIIFNFENKIEPQVVFLKVTYQGTLNDRMAGFYRSSYEYEGKKRWIAVTQFEANDARTAVPCWDEPSHKATFDVTLIAPANNIALSNMNIIETTVAENGVKTVKFARTPVMSTYLLAFVVGEFEYLEDKTKRNLPVRVWAPLGKKEEGSFALSVATQTLDFFTDYFQIEYPLPKMDMIAIPDFAAGAMENWGLVTYRNVLLLYNPQTTPTAAKQRIAYVVGHELAHQWFGNLVTMEWWTDLWLNEAFATWAGWDVVDHLFPDWKVWDQFLVNEYARGQDLDSLKSSHPIEVEVKIAEEVDEIFDAISYSKGASVLRMLVNWLGEENFQKGMRNYLNRHQYKNTLTVDLWKALSEGSNQNVSELMDGWTQQMGFPVVKVAKDGNKILVSQTRYLKSGEDTTDNSRWKIPVRTVTNTTGVENPIVEVLSKSSDHLSVPLENVEWLKVNINQTGFYRVQYSEELLEVVAKSNPFTTASDRCGLIGDSFALASAGYISTKTPLVLLSSYKQEDTYIVWNEIISNLRQLRSVWTNEEKSVQDKLKKFCIDLVVPIATKLGWEASPTDDHLTSILRPLVVGEATLLGYQPFVDEAKRRFDLFVAGDSNAIHLDLRTAVFSSVLRFGNEEIYDKLVDLYRKFDSQDQKVSILSILGNGSTPELVLRALNFMISDEVRAQDLFILLGSAANNSVGSSVTWNFFKENWDTILGRVGPFLFGRVLKIVGDGYSTEDVAKDIEEFVEKKNNPTILRSTQQALEGMRVKARWFQRDRQVVATFLG
eukprot:c21365_g1_i1.p1 GENE.c21365_g1_i1~~c21365_g1_i1.p1  ORF type:complete len:865 (+),score=378.69 c21365_g1_i1:31-2595(+)